MGLRDQLRVVCHELKMRSSVGDHQLRLRVSRLPAAESIQMMKEAELVELRHLVDRLVYDVDRAEDRRSPEQAVRYQHRTGLPPFRQPLTANWYERALHKQSQFADSLTLFLSSVGNPDHDQHAPISPPLEVECNNLTEAIQHCRQYIQEHNLGGGNWAGGQVYRGENPYAYISYNGRVWMPSTKRDLSGSSIPHQDSHNANGSAR